MRTKWRDGFGHEDDIAANILGGSATRRSTTPVSWGAMDVAHQAHVRRRRDGPVIAQAKGFAIWVVE